MASKTVLVVGASRGIGLGLVKVYAAAGWKVHATTRTLGNPGALGEVSGDVMLHPLDITNSEQTVALAEALQEDNIDVIIHNAGVKDGGHSREDVLRINADAPISVVQTLLPAVARSTQKQIALLSSQLGSRQKFGGGRTPRDIYGESKCRLNDRFRELEPSWRAQGITSVLFHPGWVATDMGGSSAPVSIQESAEGIKSTLDKLSIDVSGSFLTWQGQQHPW